MGTREQSTRIKYGGQIHLDPYLGRSLRIKTWQTPGFRRNEGPEGRNIALQFGLNKKKVMQRIARQESRSRRCESSFFPTRGKSAGGESKRPNR